MTTRPPWAGVFEVLDADGQLAEHQGIPLCQVTETQFEVGATIRYLGDTGVDASLDQYVRTLPLDRDRLSDLASVPAALRWFERPHGVHTPAALFHDYQLEADTPVRPEQADLVFRHMLKAVGVPTIRRNLLWTGVVLRTRWATSPALLALWVLLSITGLSLFVLAAVGVDLPDWLGSRGLVLSVTALAPLPASLLWGRERRAALVGAAMAIWVLPAAAIAVIALAVYQALEWGAEKLRPT